MKFFYSPGSCALATHLTLAEADADYEAIRLDFAAGEQQGTKYLAINPKGRVPALVTDRGILTETPAILLYIAQVHPHCALAPLDDLTRWRNCRPSTVISVRPFMSHTLTADVATVGRTISRPTTI